MLLCNHRSNGASHSTQRATCGELQAALFYAQKGGERVSYVRVQLKGHEQIVKQLKQQNAAAKKTLEYTIKDFNRSMPGWIADEAVKEYNIGKQQITSQKIGSIKLRGSGLESTIIFAGRNLTPMRFGMQPKKMKAPKKLSKKDRMKIPGGAIKFKGKSQPVATLSKAYKPFEITAEIKRGQRKALKGEYNTPWFIAPAAKGSSTMIPFQRSPGHPKGFKTVAAHTVSLPQMISHDGHTLKPEIAAVVWARLDEKLQTNAQRFMRKK